MTDEFALRAVGIVCRRTRLHLRPSGAEMARLDSFMLPQKAVRPAAQ